MTFRKLRSINVCRALSQPTQNVCVMLTLTLGFLLWSPIKAAPFTLGNSDVRTLPTSANGRTYTLSVSLPESYATQPTRRYPVVYFTDAYWDFATFAMDAGNLQVDSAIPEVILVGIGYAGSSPDVGSLRQIDFTPGVDPTVDSSGQASGKAQEFLGVIANEFIPLVENSYRVDPSFRVLAGSSYGGLFTLYALFERPGLFQGYIASSPSLWWRGGYVQARETEYANSHTAFATRLFLSFATEDPFSISGTTQNFYRQIAARNYSGLALAVREIDGERHSSTKPEAFNRGLRFTLAPLAPRPTTTGFNSRTNFINLSTRGFVGSGDSVMIAGFVVQGLLPKRILVRAAGPALSTFNVTGVLSDPELRVHNNSGTVIAQNDNWGDVAGIASAFQLAGAFLFTAGSRDAATLVTVNPGAYTVVVSGVNGAIGNALVEAYELP